MARCKVLTILANASSFLHALVCVRLFVCSALLAVNLPCVVEVHKTVDQVTLFKSGDVGQMVIVYADEEELW